MEKDSQAKAYDLILEILEKRYKEERRETWILSTIVLIVFAMYVFLMLCL